MKMFNGAKTQNLSSATALAPEPQTNQQPGRSRRFWLKNTLVAGAGLAALGFPAATQAQTGYPDSLPSPIQGSNARNVERNSVTPVTNYISFSGLDFRPAGNSVSFDFTGTDANYCGIYPTSGTSLFTAKLTLPDRAKITECEFYYKRTTSGTDTFYLFNTIPSSGAAGYLAVSQLSATSSQIQTTTLTGAALPWITSTATQSLYLGWLPDSGRPILFGAKVSYVGGVAHFGAN